MFQLFETINITDNSIINPELHLTRVHRSSSALWGESAAARIENLFSFLEVNDLKWLELISQYKLKIIYDSKNVEYEITKYVRRKIDEVFLIENNEISYPHKFTDRAEFEKMRMGITKSNPNKNFELLIVKNGLITDSTFSNLVFQKGDLLVTPDDCLLEGTKRSLYLKKGLIRASRIKAEDLNNFESVHFINSMNNLGDLQYFFN
jgi:4-amino-4-deoxychorismate lyase